jgi:hypothetical protein
VEMPYRTAFDVAQVGFQWWPSLLIAIVSALVMIVGWALENSGDDDDSRGCSCIAATAPTALRPDRADAL